MTFDKPRRYTARTLDTPSVNTPAPSDPHLLGVELAEVLRELGEQVTVRTPVGGPSQLFVVGADERLNEVITLGWRVDGSVCALWSWGEELPADVDQAAAAIQRVINPAVV